MNARATAATLPLLEGAPSNEIDPRKDEIVAMLAHELRGPLARIRIAAAILSQPHTAAVCQQARTIIDQQVSDLARLIDEHAGRRSDDAGEAAARPSSKPSGVTPSGCNQQRSRKRPTLRSLSVRLGESS